MNDLATTPYTLSAEERADLEEALAEAKRGEFASDADVQAMFARHGLPGSMVRQAKPVE